MIYLRRPQRRACGVAAVFLVGVIWPAASRVGTETPAALAARGSVFWLAPTAAGNVEIAGAVDDLAAGKAARALPVLERAARQNELGGYALLYLGRAQLALDQRGAARATADRLIAAAPKGYLADAARALAADVAEASGDWAAAAGHWQALVALKPLDPERAHLRLGQAAAKAGNATQAVAAA